MTGFPVEVRLSRGDTTVARFASHDRHPRVWVVLTPSYFAWRPACFPTLPLRKPKYRAVSIAAISRVVFVDAIPPFAWPLMTVCWTDDGGDKHAVFGTEPYVWIPQFRALGVPVEEHKRYESELLRWIANYNFYLIGAASALICMLGSVWIFFVSWGPLYLVAWGAIFAFLWNAAYWWLRRRMRRRFPDYRIADYRIPESHY